MKRQVSEEDKVPLAYYGSYTDVHYVYSQPENITRSNYKFEGKYISSLLYNNVDTMKIILTVPVATCELIAAYFCEFEYERTHKLSADTIVRMSFMENVTSIGDYIIVSEVIMTAYQSFLTCKINGTQNMRVEWEAAQCSAPPLYKKILELDKNFFIQEDSKELTQTKCNDSVREYTTQLCRTEAYCSIRCIAYDKYGKKINNYHQSLDQNIVKGVKRFAFKKPLSYWWHLLVVSFSALSVIGCVVCGLLCCRKYNIGQVEYDDPTQSTTEELLSVHIKPDTSVKPSIASSEKSTLPATPPVPESSLMQTFSSVFTSLFNESEPGLEGARQPTPLFSEITEEEDH